MTALPNLIELRQYTLHPGRRDALIDLFEREFVESQEALGLRVIGTFRDLDDPDRFVWLRGFDERPRRAPSLAAFYDGPVWQRHRGEANATMVDSDDVLLLRPAAGGVEVDVEVGPAGLVTATICMAPAEALDALLARFEQQQRADWLAAGARWVAALVTDGSPNDYPRLPIREGVSAVVWLAGFADEEAQLRHAGSMAASPAWKDFCAGLAAPPQRLRLAPTDRSAIRPDYIGRPHDFDFLVGCWSVDNRRLRQRHVGSDDWDEFAGVAHAWTHLGGLVSVDQIDFPTRGFSGCTVRTLDLATRRWSIYWINSHVGTLCAPVHGGFVGDRGEFWGDDEDEGRPVKVRFLWQRRGPDAARWSQAFSLDGTRWETNWIMEMRRAQ